MSDHRSFPDAADGRASLPMEPELWAAGLSLTDARFVARQLAQNGYVLIEAVALEAHRAENERLRQLVAAAANRMNRSAAIIMRDLEDPRILRDALETKGGQDDLKA